MAKASWQGKIVAESDDVEVVEGNVYFPLDAVKPEFFRSSATHTTCPWKGEASYYDLVVGQEVNRDAAWFYPAPKEAAEKVRDRIAFWHGVQVSDVMR